MIVTYIYERFEKKTQINVVSYALNIRQKDRHFDIGTNKLLPAFLKMRHLFCDTRMIIEINICDRKLYRRPSSLYLNTQQRNYEVKYFRTHQKKKINTPRRDGAKNFEKN